MRRNTVTSARPSGAPASSAGVNQRDIVSDRSNRPCSTSRRATMVVDTSLDSDARSYSVSRSAFSGSGNRVRSPTTPERSTSLPCPMANAAEGITFPTILSRRISSHVSKYIAICPFISRKRGVRTAEAPFLFRTHGSLRIITARVISGVPYFASACSSQMIPYPNASYSPFLPPCRYTLF